MILHWPCQSYVVFIKSRADMIGKVDVTWVLRLGTNHFLNITHVHLILTLN
jgi:hypothetical protein